MVLTKKNCLCAFVDTSVGAHNQKQLRAGLSFVIADENLPAVD